MSKTFRTLVFVASLLLISFVADAKSVTPQQASKAVAAFLQIKTAMPHPGGCGIASE